VDFDVTDQLKVKLKVKFLRLTKHHAIKTYWEWRHRSTHSLTSAPRPLYPQGKKPAPVGYEDGWAPEPVLT